MPEADESQAPHPFAAALQASFAQGVALHQQGKLAEAERLYEEILRWQPDHFDALHLLGVIAAQTHRTERGVELIGKAIGINPNVAEAHSNLGNGLRLLKRPEEALASFDKAVALSPDFAIAHYNRGIVLRDLSYIEEALASFERAIALKPDYAEAYSDRGSMLRSLNRPNEALASLDKALALRPDYVEAHNNRGNVLNDLKRFEEALASYDRAIEHSDAHYNRGNVLNELKRSEEALASYDRAIALKPDHGEAHNNRGKALRDLERPEEALASFSKSIAYKPNDAEAYGNRGKLLSSLKRYDEALAAYDKALAINPELTDAEGSRLHAKSHLCDWSNFDAECAHLIWSIKTRNVVTAPFLILAIPSSPDEQLQCAKMWTANIHPPSEKKVWQGERYNHDRIRVAYFSADFFQHATSYLMAGMFECHDKSKFETIAISWGPNDNSELRRRLEASFERFIDVQGSSDDQIAHLIRASEVDILVDLKGFTKDSRTRIAGQRPAPIQVNYLGYPGTMGAPYIDYIIADRIVIPDHQREFYSEKIVQLPYSYQVNDSKRLIADRASTRNELGLPSTGFVFCCFNNNYKITPPVFDGWMRILKHVEGSVLWLLETNPRVASNLQREAAKRGVSMDRLVFAKRMPLSDHLARHRSADLFLDTLPCNAHTTASDALWAGLPVLTCLGETFAGRVAASLLNALNIQELVTNTPEAYERMAIDLAACPEKLAAIKEKLTNNRLAAPLFDTKLFTRHIETAYTMMYERHQAGMAPDHIGVPA